MAENLFCDEQNCGQPANSFGFVKGVKWRTCENHVLALLNKKVTVYDIAGFSFIQSTKDGPLYEERRELMQKGLGNLGFLESRYEEDWQNGQRRITETGELLHKVIQQSLQEMWYRGLHRYEEMKQDLAEVRSRLERLILDKNFQLSPQDTQICSSVPAGPFMCFIVGDCRLPVVEAVMGNFHLLNWNANREEPRNWGAQVKKFAKDQADTGKASTAAEASGYAKQLGSECPDYKEAALKQSEVTTKRLCELLRSKELHQAEEHLKAGKAACQAGDFDRALRELQKSKDLLSEMKDSELYLRISSGIAEIYYQTGRWQETVSECKQILSIWNKSPFKIEFLRNLYYLTSAHCWLNQDNQGTAASQEWAQKLSDGNPHSQSILLCIEANKLRLQGRTEAAKQLYEQALGLDESPSYITICSRWYLAETLKSLCDVQKAENAYIGACELFSVHFPYSNGYAGCLFSAGCFYQSTKRLQMAEDHYLQATKRYSCFPPTQSHAKCLSSLGHLYASTTRRDDAVQYYLQAISLYSTHFPRLLDYAMCLLSLGLLYTDTNRLNEGEAVYQQAIDLFSFQSQGYADSLYGLGVICERSGRKKEATQRYETAKKRYIEGKISATAEVSACDLALQRLST